ncbi:MAG: hypothetical protein WD750_05050 [Gammaproteobacteria bacterium]
MIQKFLAYHPYLTFSDPHNSTFIRPNGKQSKPLNSDTAPLFFLAKEAYSYLPEAESKEDFDDAFSHIWVYIDAFRNTFQEMDRENRTNVSVDNGTELEKLSDQDWEDLPSERIMNILWQIYSIKQCASPKEIKQAFTELFLLYALWEVENALVSLEVDEGSHGAIANAVNATNALANAMSIEMGNETLQQARRDQAVRAAEARLKHDPKQKEKAFVKDCWLEWQKKPTRYKSKASFARDMLNKCEHLISQRKIEDWCREWEFEVRT